MNRIDVEEARRRSAKIRVTVWILGALAVLLYAATIAMMAIRNGGL